MQIPTVYLILQCVSTLLKVFISLSHTGRQDLSLLVRERILPLLMDSRRHLLKRGRLEQLEIGRLSLTSNYGGFWAKIQAFRGSGPFGCCRSMPLPSLRITVAISKYCRYRIIFPCFASPRVLQKSGRSDRSVRYGSACVPDEQFFEPSTALCSKGACKTIIDAHAKCNVLASKSRGRIILKFCAHFYPSQNVLRLTRSYAQVHVITAMTTGRVVSIAKILFVPRKFLLICSCT
ncbi:hypothetical protein BKA93DRAFT_813290 [Sparassis latifolia]